MRMGRGKAVFALIFLLVFFPCALSGAEGEKTGPDVLRLLHRLEEKASGINSFKTNFIQKKKLAAFKNEIVLKGRIFMQGTDRLVWHVDEPVKYSVLITDKFIRQWDEEIDRVQEIPLSANPVMRTVLEQMRGWFSGQYAGLLKDYDVNLLQQRPIVLEFIPKDKSVVKKVVRSISIGFQEDERYLKWIKILESSGDSTSIIFENTILNAPLNESDFEVKGRV